MKKGLKIFMKKQIAVVLCILTVICSFSITGFATNKTQTDALNWVKSQVGKTLDYDGVYGGQCVDLIKYYYTFLGVNAVSGNGCDYAGNALPNGWTRVMGGAPQPGDILVYSGNAKNPYGHVAIYESDYAHYHQNFNGQYVEKITHCKYNALNNPYWGYIRPNWSSSAPINYSTISTGNYTLKNAYNGKLLEVAGGVDADKTNIQVAAAANSAKQRFYISPASTGYKMRPLSSSSRLVNAWGSAPANGANVNIYKDCNENSQWWYFEKVSGGYVIRLAYNSSLVLTLSSSDNVTVTTYSSGNKKQIWTLEAVANPQPPKPTTTEENLSMNYKSTKELSGFKSITTSNSNVVSVSGSTISAVGTGSADITATRTNGDTCIYHVNVSYTWWQWMIVICLFGWAWY